MKRYDVVVIGAGDVGLGIAFSALSEGLKVALIDKGPLGGTCLNNGCVPSKTLIHAADRILEIREASRLGIRTGSVDVDFRMVMERMRNAVSTGRTSIQEALEGSENLDFISGEAHFIDERTIEANAVRIRGKKIFIASGSRPSIPPIRGLNTVPYLTNENLLNLTEKPESMVIIGGGYVGVEYAHFFSALGTRVTVIDRNLTLLPIEEPEISALLTKEMAERVTIHLGGEISEVRQTDSGYSVSVLDVRDRKETAISSQTVMVAAGRRSNADVLKVGNAGIETDKANFIKVDDLLQTNKRHIWAVGDAIGRAMFTHAGDREAEIAWHNATTRKKMRMDFESVPHAVFTSPQIASVGLTEEQARRDHEILVGRAQYSDTVMGEAMAETKGFAKAIVEKGSKRILGFHIIGPHAAILIQEVANVVAKKGDVTSVTACMHIFPALSGLIPETLHNLE